MSSEMYTHKLKMEAEMAKVHHLEEEKKQTAHEYDVRNKRVLPSQGTGASKTEKKAATKPPMSA